MWYSCIFLITAILLQRVRHDWAHRHSNLKTGRGFLTTTLWHIEKTVYRHSRALQVVLLEKNPPANTGVTREKCSIPGSGRSLGGGNGSPLQYSSLEKPWTEEPGGLQSMGSLKVRHNWAHRHSHHTGRLGIQDMVHAGGNNGNSDRLYFLGLQNHCGWWLQPWN